MGKFSIKSHFWKMLVGSALTGLAISLGMVGILKLLCLSINPGITASFSAVGTAIYATRGRKLDEDL